MDFFQFVLQLYCFSFFIHIHVWSAQQYIGLYQVVINKEKWYLLRSKPFTKPPLVFWRTAVSVCNFHTFISCLFSLNRSSQLVRVCFHAALPAWSLLNQMAVENFFKGIHYTLLSFLAVVGDLGYWRLQLKIVTMLSSKCNNSWLHCCASFFL